MEAITQYRLFWWERTKIFHLFHYIREIVVWLQTIQKCGFREAVHSGTGVYPANIFDKQPISSAYSKIFSARLPVYPNVRINRQCRSQKRNQWSGQIIGARYGQNPFEQGTLFLFCGRR